MTATLPSSSEIVRIPGHWLMGSANDAGLKSAPHRFLAEMSLRHGGLARFRILNQSLIACSSVEAVRHVLVHRHENYPRSAHRLNGALVVGSGLIFNEGEEWLSRRRQVLPAFKSDTLGRLNGIAVEETRAMLAAWETRRRAGEPVDALAEMQRLTLSVMGRALFGCPVSAEDAVAFGTAVRDSLRIVRTRNRNPLSLPVWVPTASNRKLYAVRDALDEFVERHIAARVALPESEWPNDMLTTLLRVRDPETGEPLSRVALRDETKTLFVAGFETTANSLAWCLYLLAKHPEIAARWHAEIDAMLGGSVPDDESLNRLDFTGAIVHEALRFYPPVYNLGRVALEDDEIGGKRVRKGDILVISIYGAHRDPHEWEDPEVFRPERFMPGQTWNRDAFMPFSVGKHRCIGNGFAMVETMVVLAMIGQRFELSLPQGFEAGESANITLTPTRPIPLTLRPRA